MGAANCVAYFGLRFEIGSDEIEALETRSDPRQIAARKGRLKSYWGSFGSEGEQSLLFVGNELAILGPEDEMSATFAADALQRLMADTAARLKEAGFEGAPSLHLEWEEDF